MNWRPFARKISTFASTMFEESLVSMIEDVERC